MKTKAGHAEKFKNGGRLLIMIWGVAVILCACFAMVATPVKAATTYDGTYDITLSGNVYNFATDSVEFTTDTAPDFLIISNGRISDAGFDGTYKNFPASKQVPPPSPRLEEAFGFHGPEVWIPVGARIGMEDVLLQA
jgi:hypothetical protein